MSYTKICPDGTKVSVPYWHDYCCKHKVFFKLSHGCVYCQKEKQEKKEK